VEPNFSLTPQMLTTILQGLGEVPYRVAAPIIAELQRQAQAIDAARQAEEPAAEEQPS
jgi:hypothetical protein